MINPAADHHHHHRFLQSSNNNNNGDLSQVRTFFIIIHFAFKQQVFFPLFLRRVFLSNDVNFTFNSRAKIVIITGGEEEARGHRRDSTDTGKCPSRWRPIRHRRHPSPGPSTDSRTPPGGSTCPWAYPVRRRAASSGAVRACPRGTWTCRMWPGAG